MKNMQESMRSEQENEVMMANREHMISTLPEEIQDSVDRLQTEAPNSAMADFVNRQLGLNRGEKIIKLDGMLNMIGERIDSFVALRDPDEQQAAVENCEVITNPYMNDDEKKQALKKLENLLG